ncbi:hypothetical protein D3C77_565700 [compost metagenome]
MLNHLQTLRLNHSPEQIMGSQSGEIIVKPTKIAHSTGIECQYTPHIGQAAHQVEVEIRLEDRVRGRKIIVGTFIDVQTPTVAAQSHPLGQDHQRMSVQAITSAQQKQPIGVVIILQPPVEREHTKAITYQILHAIAHPSLQRGRPHHHNAPWGIGLLRQTIQAHSQCCFVTLLTKKHGHDAWLNGPLLDTLGQ